MQKKVLFILFVFSTRTNEEKDMKILKVTMLLILLSASNQQNQFARDSEHCGQYGFRCVDSESFQICTYPDLDGLTEAPEIVRKCFDHNVCDEDNPAYCTPLDRPENVITIQPNGKCQKKVFNKRNSAGNYLRKANVPMMGNAYGFRNLNIRKSDDANPFGFDNEVELQTEAPTTESEDYPSFRIQKFECESFGYFPGITERSIR